MKLFNIAHSRIDHHGRSAVNISSLANGAFGEHRRQRPSRQPQAVDRVIGALRWRRIVEHPRSKPHRCVHTSVAQACVMQITLNFEPSKPSPLLMSPREAPMMMAFWAIRLAMIAFILWCILTELVTELQGLL